ncbi:hypothetical protein O3P69_017959 [Scylla paramamosain]|uniref:Uncharacterized protein n=1 Tax=Scylla paramamosain TaxID=85552 RepID=A0AAW0TH61_SCYPA
MSKNRRTKPEQLATSSRPRLGLVLIPTIDLQRDGQVNVSRMEKYTVRNDRFASFPCPPSRRRWWGLVHVSMTTSCTCYHLHHSLTHHHVVVTTVSRSRPPSSCPRVRRCSSPQSRGWRRRHADTPGLCNLAQGRRRVLLKEPSLCDWSGWKEMFILESTPPWVVLLSPSMLLMPRCNFQDPRESRIREHQLLIKLRGTESGGVLERDVMGGASAAPESSVIPTPPPREGFSGRLKRGSYTLCLSVIRVSKWLEFGGETRVWEAGRSDQRDDSGNAYEHEGIKIHNPPSGGSTRAPETRPTPTLSCLALPYPPRPSFARVQQLIQVSPQGLKVPLSRVSLTVPPSLTQRGARRPASVNLNKLGQTRALLYTYTHIPSISTPRLRLRYSAHHCTGMLQAIRTRRASDGDATARRHNNSGEKTNTIKGNKRITTFRALVTAKEEQRREKESSEVRVTDVWPRAALAVCGACVDHSRVHLSVVSQWRGEVVEPYPGDTCGWTVLEENRCNWFHATWCRSSWGCLLLQYNWFRATWCRSSWACLLQYTYSATGFMQPYFSSLLATEKKAVTGRGQPVPGASPAILVGSSTILL